MDPDGMTPIGCCFPTDIGDQIVQGFKNKVAETKQALSDAADSVGEFLSDTGDAIGSFVEKLSGGEGSDGYNFTHSEGGGGDQDRKGNMTTQSIDGETILNAASAAGSTSAPLNKAKVPDLDTPATVMAGIDKGGAAADAVKDAGSGTIGTSNNNEPSTGNESVSVQLHTKHPDFGFVDGQLMDTGRTTFRDTTVTSSTADSIVRSNDSIQLEKVREARRKFLNRNN